MSTFLTAPLLAMAAAATAVEPCDAQVQHLDGNSLLVGVVEEGNPDDDYVVRVDFTEMPGPVVTGFFGVGVGAGAVLGGLLIRKLRRVV